MILKEGDWVRYKRQFCEDTSTTVAGMRDMLSKRGKVVRTFRTVLGGRLCDVDWGDVIVQHMIGDNPSIEACDEPSAAPKAPRSYERAGTWGMF